MITIYYDFVFLNEYINAERRNKYIGAKIKRDTTNAIMYELLNQPKIKTPCGLCYTWIVKSKRRDIDNLQHGAKYVNDSLVKAEIIPNDNLNHITEVKHKFEIGNKVGVKIEVY